MQPLLLYAIKVILCSGILFGYYLLALRNKIFHQYNRFYLLASVALSLILPFVQINIWHSVSSSASGPIKILKVVSGGNEYLDEIFVTAKSNNFTTAQLLQLFYCCISLIFLYFFIQGLIKIYTLYKSHQHSIIENIHLINTSAKEAPFSFLKYIFWNIHIDINSPTGTQIFKHELAHVQQKHTHDKLFINTILIFLWCNPFYWLIRKELNMIHEFIADKTAVEDSDTAAFASMILQATYPQQHFHLTNKFFYSPIKRRLNMLTKNNKTKAGYIGRVLVLPLLLLTFAAFTFKTKTFNHYSNLLYKGEKITVVVDAGHGGKDYGAVAANGILEKDIVLSITKKIKQLNQNKNLEIVLLRGEDVYLSPQQKVELATKAGADLFISVHVDAVEEKNINTGMTVWIPKNDFPKIDESKLLGNAILASFKNNSALYIYDNLNQSGKNVWVLKENKCPSVLLETGFMSNENDVAYLTNENNQQQIAKNILAGIESYAAESKKNIFEKTYGTESAYSQKDTIPGEINFSVKKITVKNNGNIKEEVVTMQGNVLLEKKDTEKMLVIINGKRVNGTALHNVTIQSKTAKIYTANNKEAISQYGDEAVNGVMIFDGASIEKNNETQKETTIIRVDSATMIVTAAAKDELSLKDTTKPLYVVNGIVKIEFDLKTIPSENIERINVLKNKNATDKYGDKGKNGVVEVVTKNKNQRIFSKSPQSINIQDTTDDKIFTKVENEASFPGGKDSWKNYLMTNIDAAIPVKEGWKPGNYQVIVEFIVDKNGNIKNVKTINYEGTKTATHCIDLIKKGPKWQPALQNGHKVTSYRRQPISFVIEG